MDTSTFYAAAAALNFTLLGFWWVIVQFRHAELTGEPGVRRFALLVSLQFVLPGLVSLASLLTTGPLWRVAFAAAGIAGSAAVVVGLAAARAAPGSLPGITSIAWLALPLYALAVVFAAAPDLARTGLGLEPLQAEGFILVFLLLVGVLLAWFLFATPDPDRETDDRAAIR